MALRRELRLGAPAAHGADGVRQRHLDPGRSPRGREIVTRDEVLGRLRRFKETHQDRYHIVRLGIFGSAARDRLTGTSDIDVVVELTVPDLFTVIGIKQDLEDELHCAVDVVRYRDSMNAFLKRRIDQEALYV